MKIIVIGLGSMGKRRIRLMRKHYQEIMIAGVDARNDRRMEAWEQFGINTYGTLAEAYEKIKPDAAFICTSPLSHPVIAQECLELRLNVFSEIDLVNENHDILIEKARNWDLQYYLSSTPLYRREIKYLLDKIHSLENGSRCHYRYHVGQYLPDWHPWESYKDFFVSDKRTNGCREILAIELPWIIKTFGKIKSVFAKTDTISDLGLAYPDTYTILIEHETGHMGTMNIDIVARVAVRSLEVYGREVYLAWNGKPDGMFDYSVSDGKMRQVHAYDEIDKDNRYSENIIENAYLEEISAFFTLLRGIEAPKYYTLEEEAEVLRIIDEIEGI